MSGPHPSAPRPPSDIASQMMESGMAQKGTSSAQQQAMQQMMAAQGQTGAQQKPPREMGTIVEEAQRAVTDVAEGLVDAAFGPIKNLLGLTRPPKTPEEQAKLQQFHQNWQRLSMEQQQVAQMRLQQEMQRKQMMEQETMMKKQQEAQKKQQGFSMPSGKVSGQAAMDKMQRDRKGMGGASGD